jgi:O-antigen/teichoic acid export membrane protein
MSAVPRRAERPAAAHDDRPLPEPEDQTAVGEGSADDRPVQRSHSEAAMRRRHVRGSSLLLVGRGLSILFTTATQVVVVRALTKSDYGAFAYALVLAGAGQTLLSLGQGRLLSRFMAKYEEERDYNRMFGSMALAAGTILVTSAVAIAIMFVFSGQLIAPTVNSPAEVRVVLILVFLGPLMALDQTFVALFAVFSRPKAIFFRKYIFTPGLQLAVVVGLALTGASVTFLAIGYLTAGAIGIAVYAVVAFQVLRQRGLLQHLHPRRLILPYRAVFSFSLPLITNELFVLTLNVVGVIILGHYHSTVGVASYRAVVSPARLNNAVVQSFVPMFLPLAARLFHRGDTRGLHRTYWQTAAAVAVLSFPIFAVTGPLAPQVTVTLFGARYADSSLVLEILAAGYFFSVALGFNAYTLQVCERIKYLVWVNLTAIALNIVVCLLLVQRHGAVGVAIANLVALVVQNVLNQWALRRELGTSFIDRSCLGLYAVMAAASVGLWLFRELVHPNLIVGLVAAGLVSLAVLFVSRSAIELSETFPEITRVPVLKWLVR